MRRYPTRVSVPTTLSRGFFADVGLPELTSSPSIATRDAAVATRSAPSRSQMNGRLWCLLFGWLTLALAALAVDRAAGPRSLAFFDSVFRVQRDAGWDIQLVGLGLLLGALSLTLLWVGRQTAD